MTIESVSRLVSCLDWVLQNSSSIGVWPLAVLVGCDLKIFKLYSFLIHCKYNTSKIKIVMC